MGKPRQDADSEVRSRYGDIVAAAAKAREAGDHERADELMTTAGRILADEQARAVARSEEDNYARSHAAIEPTDEE